MERDAPLRKPAQLGNDIWSLGIAQEPAPHDRIGRMHGHVQRRQPILHDPVEVPGLQIRERRKVAIAERQAVIVVADVERLPQAVWVAVHKAEIAVIRTAPDPGRFEGHAHRQPFRALDVVLDLLPRREPSPQDELLVRSQELPIKKVLEGSAVHLEEFCAWDKLEGGTQGLRRHRLDTNHDLSARGSRSF